MTTMYNDPVYDVNGNLEWKIRRRTQGSLWRNNQYYDSEQKAIRGHLSAQARGVESELYLKACYPTRKLYEWLPVDLETIVEKEECFGKPRSYWQYLIEQAKISLGLIEPDEMPKLRWRVTYPRKGGWGHEYFDDLVSAFTLKLKHGKDTQVHVQIGDSPFIPEDGGCIEWLLAAESRLGHPRRYWLRQIEDAEICAGKVKLQFERVDHEFKDDGLPLFRLSDVPENWEIELDEDFNTALDRLNRPWLYTEKKKRGRNLYWPANWKSSKSKENRGFKLYRRIWGWHRFKKGRDNGAWIQKDQIRDLKILDMTDEDIERAVIGLRKGPDCTMKNVLRARLPLKPDKWWAKLFGHYYSSGRVKPRFRQGRYSEVVFKLRGHEDVLPMLMETLNNIGVDAGISEYDPGKYSSKKGEWDGIPKSKVLGSTSQRSINVSRPVWLIMQKFGLSTDFLEDLERKGRTSSANINPRIPQWISDNNDFMHAFIEGYINGSKGQSLMIRTRGKHFLTCQVLIKSIGRPITAVQRFITTIAYWFANKGLTYHLREEPWRDDASRPNLRFSLGFMSREALDWIVENFEIRRPDLRARLLLRRDAWEDPILFEILLELRTPDNVILGLIYEQPKTREELSTSLQLREDRLTAGLIALQKRGMIERRGEYYVYEPAEFIKRFIRDRKKQAELLANRMHRYSARLINQCQQCGRVYINPKTECGLCGGEVIPVPRKEILKGLNRKRLRELMFAHRVVVQAKLVPAVTHRIGQTKEE